MPVKVLERLVLALCFLTLAVGFSGCATTDDENLTERPWNTPKTWETGIPQSMQQGR